MACFISSNDNRFYVALETGYGQVAAATAENRLPAGKLRIRQSQITPRRRDKTGGRTFVGMPPELRTVTSYELTTFLTEWPAPAAYPVHDPLLQSTLGSAGLTFESAEVQTENGPTSYTMTSPHGLEVGQAVRFGNDLRFVAAVIDTATVILNAPFTSPAGAGALFQRAITYSPASTELSSVTVHDYWAPADAVQRILAGAAVDRMRIAVNGDFHQCEFRGPAAELLEDAAFVPGQAGLSEFPIEPAIAELAFPIVPGSLGQVWMGVEPTQFHSLLEAEVTVENNVEPRAYEFGRSRPACVIAGERNVSIDFRLVSNTNAETRDLYLAARQRVPVSVMVQLGHAEGRMCGIYLPAVVLEIPEFEDDGTRLEWRIRSSRAQGFADDEIFIAFA